MESFERRIRVKNPRTGCKAILLSETNFSLFEIALGLRMCHTETANMGSVGPEMFNTKWLEPPIHEMRCSSSIPPSSKNNKTERGSSDS